MTATTLNRYRPYHIEGNTIWEKIKSFNYGYWIRRSPMVVLSLPAAYATSAFMGNVLPHPFDWSAGLGIEIAYLGCVSFADQQYDADRKTTILWWFVNLVAVFVSALINTLHASNSIFGGVHAESFVYGIPLPVLAFAYSLLLHRITNRNAAR